MRPSLCVMLVGALSATTARAQGVVVVDHQYPAQPAPAPAPAPPAQPVYGTQPVAYGYQQPAVQHRQRRHRVRYREGMELPPGARTYQRRSLGMLIPGAVLFALPYVSTALTFVMLEDTRSSTRQPQNVLLVPLIGPFLTMPRLDENFEGEEIGVRRGLLLVNGLMQLVGGTLAILGAIPRTYMEYYAGNEPGLHVGPRFAGGPGLELQARW